MHWHTDYSWKNLFSIVHLPVKILCTGKKISSVHHKMFVETSVYIFWDPRARWFALHHEVCICIFTEKLQVASFRNVGKSISIDIADIFCQKDGRLLLSVMNHRIMRLHVRKLRIILLINCRFYIIRHRQAVKSSLILRNSCLCAAFSDFFYSFDSISRWLEYWLLICLQLNDLLHLQKKNRNEIYPFQHHF